MATVALALQGCSADTPAQQDTEHYSYTERNNDGIGKFYMGREISWVMGHQGARWLDRPEREQEERTDLVIENLPIKTGDRVADMGAGTGYFSVPMSKLVGDTGIVYAVDIQPEMLAKIETRTDELGISNIERVLATDKDPGLPAEAIDMALFVDVYHELEWPREVMSALYDSLVPGGKVVLIEYRGEDPEIPILRLHKMTAEQVRKEMAAIGLAFVQNYDFLPSQHFLVFEKPPE